MTRVILGNLIDKLYGFKTFVVRARATQIERLGDSHLSTDLTDSMMQRLLSEISACYYEARTEPSPAQRIAVNCRWADLMLKLLDLGNRDVDPSLPYRLREAEPEELEGEEK